MDGFGRRQRDDRRLSSLMAVQNGSRGCEHSAVLHYPAVAQWKQARQQFLVGLVQHLGRKPLPKSCFGPSCLVVHDFHGDLDAQDMFADVADVEDGVMGVALGDDLVEFASDARRRGALQ